MGLLKLAHAALVCGFLLVRTSSAESCTNALDGNATLRRVCYYTLTPEVALGSQNAELCTHIICGFAVLSNGTLAPSQPGDIAECGRLVALKQDNPALRVMLSLGAKGSTGHFSAMIGDSGTRRTFIESTITLLRKYGFDGLDIDWEFPGQGALPFEDRKNFDLFLKETRGAFRNESRVTHRSQLLLSVAVAPTEAFITEGYDAAVIAKYADFINLMSYDYHMFKAYLPFTGHNSPLFKRKVEEGIFSTLHVAWSSEFWVQRGATRSKLNIGLPLYGRSYTLLRPESHGFDAPATGTGPGGDDGVSYPWVCQFLKEGATAVLDDESQAPYAYKNLTWVAYDDPVSVRSKVVWTMARGFGGVMTFSLNQDDADGVCGQGSFPIHNMIRNMLSS